MKSLLLFFSLVLSASLVQSQSRKNNPPKATSFSDRPALVVGIVVDQMRYDFLYRYLNRYSQGGFRRLLTQGFSFANCQYSYYPTYTGPGHASVYTGTTPALHGIVGNNWFEIPRNRGMYCVQDDSVTAIGGSSDAGKMSPRNLQTYSVADQIRLASNFKGKSFGLSIKDRGAILPAGHGADAAFWFDPSNGHFISSSWYKKLNGRLPEWLEKFNRQELAKAFKDSLWRTLLPSHLYEASGPDLQDWESAPLKNRKPILPFSLKEDEGGDYDVVRRTPFGNRLTTLAAQALIKGESLGKDDHTDFLGISYSSTDIVGHAAGPFAVETQDTYLRLDRDLEELFRFLDAEVGNGRYLCFLTADHGIMEIPAFLRHNGLPSELFRTSVAQDSLKRFCLRTFGTEKLIRTLTNLQIHLNPAVLKETGIPQKQAVEALVSYAESLPGVFRAFAYGGAPPFPSIPFQEKYEAGWFPGRSGDIQLVLAPGILDFESPKGTTHGSPYSYDSRVPCLWMGWKIKSGETAAPIKIQDIAPTLSGLLRIMEPNGSTGTAHTIPLINE